MLVVFLDCSGPSPAVSSTKLSSGSRVPVQETDSERLDRLMNPRVSSTETSNTLSGRPRAVSSAATYIAPTCM